MDGNYKCIVCDSHHHGDSCNVPGEVPEMCGPSLQCNVPNGYKFLHPCKVCTEKQGDGLPVHHCDETYIPESQTSACKVHDTYDDYVVHSHIVTHGKSLQCTKVPGDFRRMVMRRQIASALRDSHSKFKKDVREIVKSPCLSMTAGRMALYVSVLQSVVEEMYEETKEAIREAS